MSDYLLDGLEKITNEISFDVPRNQRRAIFVIRSHYKSMCLICQRLVTPVIFVCDIGPNKSMSYVLLFPSWNKTVSRNAAPLV